MPGLNYIIFFHLTEEYNRDSELEALRSQAKQRHDEEVSRVHQESNETELALQAATSEVKVTKPPEPDK